MQPIDQPFRFSRTFCVVWALLVVPTFLLTRPHDLGSWYSRTALLILAPLFAAFLIYGPVLLVRQGIHSGSRGWVVLRLFLSIILTAAILLGALFISGFYTEGRARLFASVFTAIATAYLSWNLERQERNA